MIDKALLLQCCETTNQPYDEVTLRYKTTVQPNHQTQGDLEQSSKLIKDCSAEHKN